MNTHDFAGKVLDITLRDNGGDCSGAILEKVVIEEIGNKLFFFGITAATKEAAVVGVRAMIAVDEAAQILIYDTVAEYDRTLEKSWAKAMKPCASCGEAHEHCPRCGNHVDTYGRD